MEVMIPSHSLDFDFNSARSSPNVSAPSTPRCFGNYYFSAPTSPSHISQFYKDFDEFLIGDDGGVGELPSTVPFDWEEKPGMPKQSFNNGDDFAFDVSQDMETASLSAEDLFDGGVIKPLKPPQPAAEAPSKQRSTRKIIQGAFSPRHRSKRETDPAARNAAAPSQRGRERDGVLSRPPSRRAARSLSPLRDAPNLWEGEEKEAPENGKKSSALPMRSKAQKKWSLKDFFLFRSASEGRASDKDPLRKYTASFRRPSFDSRRRGQVSAHELHYTTNRAVSEDLKKKTFLPYKQGILGKLAFNPAVHALANGFGFSRK